ncbi:hypothetical protein V8E53_011614 [Lactarius tabidus]
MSPTEQSPLLDRRTSAEGEPSCFGSYGVSCLARGLPLVTVAAAAHDLDWDAPSSHSACAEGMTTNYCSLERQKKYWPSHKAICQHTIALVAATKQQPLSADFPDENIAPTPLYAAALQFRRVPSNVRQSALLVELAIRPSGDAQRQFTITSTHIVTSREPLVAADVQRSTHSHSVQDALLWSRLNEKLID